MEKKQQFILRCNYEFGGEMFDLWVSGSNDIKYIYDNEMSTAAKKDFEHCYNYEIVETSDKIEVYPK